MRRAKRFVRMAALAGICALFLWQAIGRTEPGAAAAGGGGEAEVLDSYEKKVALTFDDGPHPAYTETLLDGLAERGVKATFFLIGTNIEGREDLVRRMYEEGHRIGSHTYSHVQLTTVEVSAACEEIEKTNALIESITGERVLYIRPPFGSWMEELECAVDMTPVMWSVDPMDWKTQNTERVVTSVMNDVGDGDIILLHDVYPTSVEAALEIVDRLLAQGYTFVTVDEIILD